MSRLFLLVLYNKLARLHCLSNVSTFLWQMVLMEESRDKPTLVIDRDPEGLGNIVESSQILEASHVREVSNAWIFVFNHLRIRLLVKSVLVICGYV